MTQCCSWLFISFPKGTHLSVLLVVSAAYLTQMYAAFYAKLLDQNVSCVSWGNRPLFNNCRRVFYFAAINIHTIRVWFQQQCPLNWDVQQRRRPRPSTCHPHGMAWPYMMSHRKLKVCTFKVLHICTEHVNSGFIVLSGIAAMVNSVTFQMTGSAARIMC